MLAGLHPQFFQVKEMLIPTITVDGGKLFEFLRSLRQGNIHLGGDGHEDILVGGDSSVVE